VQGGAEVGCVPAADAATRELWTKLWGAPVPEQPGLSTDAMLAASARGDIDAFWMVGGNFLGTIGDERRTREALGRPRLLVHHDIVLTPPMLVDPSETVLLLPATTRYEAPGGGTETSTERRIIFSPEIDGRRIAAARPEWWALGEVVARVRPELAAQLRYADSAAIRSEIARAIPLYAGIDRLHAPGDAIQWGGPRLFEDGRFATIDGRAHLSAVRLHGRRIPPGAFVVSTRRGKQFNSMILRDRDPLTGAPRNAVFINAEDAAAIGVSDGTRIRLTSSTGTFEGRAFLAPIRPGNLEVHWPEGLALLDATNTDPESGEPDYNAIVRVTLATPANG